MKNNKNKIVIDITKLEIKKYLELRREIQLCGEVYNDKKWCKDNNWNYLNKRYLDIIPF